jgi:cytochrome b subunit of formate dehydrogenase
MRRDATMTQGWQKTFKAAVHWSLLILTVLYLVSGLGITQYRIIEAVTLGLLTIYLAFRVHDDLLIPFIALLCLHILIEPVAWIYSRRKKHSNGTR